jgi:hypothetical protein
MQPLGPDLELGKEVAEVGDDDGGEGCEEACGECDDDDDDHHHHHHHHHHHDGNDDIDNNFTWWCAEELLAVANGPAQDAAEDVAPAFKTLGFGVWGLGFGIWDLGFGVQCLPAVVAGHASVGDCERESARVVGDYTVSLGGECEGRVCKGWCDGVGGTMSMRSTSSLPTRPL